MIIEIVALNLSINHGFVVMLTCLGEVGSEHVSPTVRSVISQ